MRVVMECPRCGHENARAQYSCTACGEWLHGASPVVGSCPQCLLPVRASEMVCSNCGTPLEPRLKEASGPRRPRESRLRASAPQAIRSPARAGGHLLSAAFVLRAVGAGLLAVGGVRAAVAVWDYRAAVMPDEALFAIYAALLWAVVFAAGVAALLGAMLALRPRK